MFVVLCIMCNAMCEAYNVLNTIINYYTAQTSQFMVRQAHRLNLAYTAIANLPGIKIKS